MRQIKFYKVIEASKAEELQQMVNNSMQAGFEPIGGITVSICSQNRKPIYAQALADYYEALNEPD